MQMKVEHYIRSTVAFVWHAKKKKVCKKDISRMLAQKAISFAIIEIGKFRRPIIVYATKDEKKGREISRKLKLKSSQNKGENLLKFLENFGKSRGKEIFSKFWWIIIKICCINFNKNSSKFFKMLKN